MTLLDILIAPLRRHEFRGKGRVLTRLAPISGTRRVRVWGAWMDLDLSDAIQRAVYLGCVGPFEVNAVRRSLRPGGVMVDVGANIGFFTVLAARLAGATGRVFAVEPSPYAFARLHRTVAENDLRTVTVGGYGLGARREERLLYVPPHSAHNHAPTMVAADGHEPIAVAVRTLDACLEEWGIDHVDLMKIDVEGHEEHVLVGAARALEQRRIRAILCEFNDHWLRRSDSSPQSLWQRLTRAGFVDAQRPGATPAFPPGCLQMRLLTLRG